MNLSSVVCSYPLTAAAALALTACSGLTSGANFGAAQTAGRVSNTTGSGSNYISHVIVVIQENRSFDDLFATFPGADGATSGCMKSYLRLRRPPLQRNSGSGGCPAGDESVPLQQVNLVDRCDWSHSYRSGDVDYDHGKMDGFGLEGGGVRCHGKAGTAVYQYVDPSQVEPYWSMAQQYVLGDQMFQTQLSGSFTAHQDLIAGSTIVNQPQDSQSLVDFPTGKPWGCDAPAGTATSLLVYGAKTKKLNLKYNKGPFPCLGYETMRDLLDAKGVSWKYYSPPEPGGTGRFWNGFDAIESVREGPEWTSNIAGTKTFFKDVSSGNLPSVSWIVPDNNDSDHPAAHDQGPSWVANIVNAVGKSEYWNSSAIIVVWDDWGGFYDHVPPPFLDHWGGLGFRVPMLMISPYARQTSASQPGYISHTQYEFGSILKFVEDVWALGSLGTTDERAASIVDCFDFTQMPRSFTPIQTKYSRSYFLREPYSYQPVDSE